MKTFGRLTRALVAAATLVGIVAGLPMALVLWGTSPARGEPSWDSLREIGYELGSERVLVGALTIAAWIVWLLFLRALLLEVIALREARSGAADFTGGPSGGGPLRNLARGLVIWLTMTAGAFGSMGGAGAATGSPPALATVLPIEATTHMPRPSAAAPPQPREIALAAPAQGSGERVVVEAPSDAWNLAERHLGDGLRWSELWEHNRDRIQPDGQRWLDPESIVEAGWELVLPAGSAVPAPDPAPASADASAAEVEVQAGDQFWALAERQLAEMWGRPPTSDEIAPYWQQLVDANRDRLAPPGDPDLIYPGQIFVTPAVGPDPTTVADPAGAPPTSDPTTAGGPTAATPTPAPSPAADSVAPPVQDPPETPTAPATPATTVPAGQPETTPVDPAAPDATVQPTSPPVPAAPVAAEPANEALELARPVGLAAGGITLAGLVVLLDRRRRAQQRHRARGRRVLAPPPSIERSENELRTGVDVSGAQLVDVALRAAASGSGATGLPMLRWVEVEDGSVLLVLASEAPPPRGFVAAGPGRWRTSVAGDVLVGLAGQAASPAPTLVPVGTTESGAEILVELESSGVVTVSGPDQLATDFLRALAVASVTVPWNAQPQVVLAGMSGELCALPWVTASPSLGDALTAAEAHVARTAEALRALDCGSAGQARAAGAVPDSWDPLVVISACQPNDLDDYRLAALVSHPQHAVAVVTPPGAVPPLGRSFTLDSAGLLRIDGVEVTVHARVLEEADARVVVEMLDLATRLDDTVPAAEADQTVRGAPVHEQPAEPPADDESHLAALLAEVDVVVRVLGEVEAVRLSPEGEQRLGSERQKGLEALAYMALRESAVDREDLEITLFPTGANATKTFHNTVSAARQTVGEELLPHSTSGRYELSERVVTDYGLFCDLVVRAEETDDAERAAALLGEALGLVRGEPFTGVGRGYSWVSSHRGMIVAQVVDAAEELAEVSLATGDWRTAEWAARQGLAAFPCDERMYRLLMRTAKAAGNTPGVKRAFRELCDAVADPDDGVEPIDTVHSETVALLEELTGSERQRMGA
jgi:DNA-binding SARP family transcriptional activator/nucleoid-associated protein YgaU